jgi:aspartate/methionine/tyrosine aminotransferase
MSMKFSARTNWNTEESELARALAARRAAGKPVYDLSNTNPTRCGFTYSEGLLAALASPAALEYDPNSKGLLSAREAVVRYYAEHGVAVDAEQLVLTTSTSEAYSYLFQLLCDAGSEVLVPQPSYPLFDFLGTLSDIRLTSAPLVYDHGWQLELEGFRRAITPRTRAIVLVHPNNPTGHFTKPWEAEFITGLCLEHGLALIVDEVFLDFALSGEAGASFAAGLADVNCFVVSGISKICGLPQMKAAWIAVTGPDRAESMARLEVIADTFLSMNAPVQAALPHWLGGRQSIQLQILTRLRSNLASLDQLLAGQQLIHRLEAEGGWYAVLRVPALGDDEQIAVKLLDRGVYLHPGSFFGMPSSGWLVLSLLTPEQEFLTGVTGIIDYFDTNQMS